MEPTGMQLKREKELHELIHEEGLEVKDAYRDSDYLQNQEQMAGMERTVSLDGEAMRFREDSAELGKKKTWKPSDQEKEQNKKIEASRKLTSLATADTLELYNTMQERARLKREKNTRKPYDPEENWEEKQQRADEIIRQLGSIRFEKRMLTTASVKMHFSEYMDLVDSYQELNKLSKAEETRDAYRRRDIMQEYATQPLVMQEKLAEFEQNSNKIRKQMLAFDGPMGVLSERMRCYLGRNRLSIDGDILDDKVKTKTFAFTKTTDELFRNKDSALQKKIVDQSVYDPKSLLDAKEDILGETTEVDCKQVSKLQLILEEKEGITFDGVTGDNALSFVNTDPVQRVKNIPVMRKYTSDLKNRIEDGKKALEAPMENADALTASRWKQQITENQKALRRELVMTQTALVLAEAEARLLFAKDEKEKEAALKKTEEIWSDFERVIQRLAKEQQPLTGAVSYNQSARRVTAQDAINSESDRANYAFKGEFFKLADALKGGNLAEIAAKAEAYAKVTHYSTSPAEETRLLMDLIRERKKLEQNMQLMDNASEEEKEAVMKLDELLYNLQHGNEQNSIPGWDEIPDSLKIDAINTALIPEGRQVKDLTDKELEKVDRVPEETKAGKHKGSYRNAALNSMRTWVRLDNDTPLFSHEPTINDLRQGKVSNCYMVASTTGLINLDPQIIKNCIRDNGDGTVTVRLYAPSATIGRTYVPKFIRIPKRVPKLKTGGEILSDGAVWMQLIERAAAQAGMFRRGRSGYQSLWYGTGDEWLELLTGASRGLVYNTISDDHMRGVENGDDVFELLSRARQDNYIYHCGSRTDVDDGMNSDHAYTVVGTKVIGDERFVTLRNPYANMSRTVNEEGNAVKSTSYFSSTADETYGQFDMPFDEFWHSMVSITYTNMNTAFPTEKKEVTAEDNTTKIVDKTLSEIAEEEENKVVTRPGVPVDNEEDVDTDSTDPIDALMKDMMDF